MYCHTTKRRSTVTTIPENGDEDDSSLHLHLLMSLAQMTKIQFQIDRRLQSKWFINFFFNPETLKRSGKSKKEADKNSVDTSTLLLELNFQNVE